MREGGQGHRAAQLRYERLDQALVHIGRRHGNIPAMNRPLACRRITWVAGGDDAPGFRVSSRQHLNHTRVVEDVANPRRSAGGLVHAGRREGACRRFPCELVEAADLLRGWPDHLVSRPARQTACAEPGEDRNKAARTPEERQVFRQSRPEAVMARAPPGLNWMTDERLRPDARIDHLEH